MDRAFKEAANKRALVRSPIETISINVSCGIFPFETALAKESNLSVSPFMAETTITTSFLWRTCCMICAAFRKLSDESIIEPPNFIITRFLANVFSSQLLRNLDSLISQKPNPLKN
jgi:hypothetical protein